MRWKHRRTRRGGGGCSPPRNFQIAIFGGKNHVIFGQNHLIFGQAMDKIFGQRTSAPLNETGPVRLYMVGSVFWIVSCQFSIGGIFVFLCMRLINCHTTHRCFYLYYIKLGKI